MESIEMLKLTVGDIIAFEIKLHGREAFEVVGFAKNSVICKSRLTEKVTKKTIGGNVYLLNNKKA